MREASIFVIVHPRAKKRFPARFRELQKLLKDRSHVLLESESGDHVETLVREARRRGFTTIAPAGGDGLLSLTVQAVLKNGLEKELTVLPLPFGTGNDFYRGFIPKHFHRSLSWINGDGESLPVDVGQVEGESGRTYFINSFSCGVTPPILENYQTVRNYMLATVKALIEFNPKPLSVTRGTETVRRDTLFFLISKGAFVGGGMRFHPDADHRKARSKIVWIPRLHRRAVAFNFPKIYWSGITSVPGVLSFDYEDLTLQLASPDTAIECDGETLRLGQNLKLTMLAGQVRIWSPLLKA